MDEHEEILAKLWETLLNHYRNQGFVIVVYDPNKIGDADPDLLEEILEERGDNFLEWEQDQK